METLEHAEQRGQQPLAEVLGFGASGDAHHVAQPPADGAGAVLAMQRALLDARLSPAHIAYVNAHATSTPLGDAAELGALKTV
jgi:3-oxoacyl-[acyl-carrier-protein] synthase II